MQVYAECGEGGLSGGAPAALLDRNEGSGPLDPLADALLSAMPGHIAVLDRGGIILAVNQAWGRLAGTSDVSGPVRGSVGGNYLALLRRAPRSLQDFARDAARGIRSVLGGEQAQFTLEYAFPSSREPRWFMMQASALPGTVCAALVSHIDISERKRAEEERAQLLAREQAARAAIAQAREHARAALRQARGVHVVTDAALRHLALEELLPAVLDRIRRIMAVDSASILLVTEDERFLTQRFARGALDSERVDIPIGQGVAGTIAASRRPLIVEDLSTVEVASSSLREGLRSLAGVPLLVHGRLLGVLHVATTVQRGFTETDIEFLKRVADRIAPALERARLYETAQSVRRQAEARTAQLQAIIDSMTDSVVVFDRELRIVQTNAAGAELLGLDLHADASSDTLSERLQALRVRDAEGRRLTGTQMVFARIARGETVAGPAAQDLALLTSAGQELVVSASGSPVRDADGRIAGGVAVLRDVTQRRQLEHEVNERANTLATLVEAITDGVIITDDRGRIVHANQAYNRLIAGDALPNFIGHSPQLRAYLLRMRDDQGIPLLPDQIPSNMLLNGQVLQGPTAMDMHVRALDGRELEVNVSGAPLRDAAGRVTGAVSVIRDVTERRTLERRTRQALQALVAMARIVVGPGPSSGGETETSAPADIPQQLAELTVAALGCESAGILALDAHSDVLRLAAVASAATWVEPAWRNSYRRVSRLTERFGPHTLARLRADEVVTFDASQLHGGRANGGHQHRENSKESWLIAPLSAGGHLIGLLRLDYGGESHSFTDEELSLAGAVGKLAAMALEREHLQREWEEARASELAARQVNQQMDEFLAIASHDLRQPATSGSGYMQLATRRFKRLASEVDLQDDAIASQFQAVEGNLARASESLERLSNLVSSLFDVSRIRAGQFEVDRAPGDLLTIVRDIVEEQRMAAPARRIDLDLPGVSTVPVLADTLRIGQVLTNYLGNALRYAPGKHPIAVTLRVEGQQARVSVRDEGPGIPPEELGRIWRRFERLRGRNGRDGRTGGIGLGLYISREIVERHGGAAGVESVVGKGSTFWFTLPLARS